MKASENQYISVSKRDLVLFGCLVFHVTWYLWDVCCLDLSRCASDHFLERSDMALCILVKMREQPSFVYINMSGG